MALSLKKNQTISLKKDDGSGLTKAFLGCGWDAVRTKSFSGAVSRLFGGSSTNIDLDASCILLDANKNIVDQVWFNQLKSYDGSIIHTGDNLTGEGDGDDEVIYVSPTRVPEKVTSLVFTVNSYRGQTFNEVENAFIRLVDTSTSPPKEIARYDLSEAGNYTGMIMAVLTRKGGQWTMTALGRPSSGRTFHTMLPDIRAALTEAGL